MKTKYFGKNLLCLLLASLLCGCGTTEQPETDNAVSGTDTAETETVAPEEDVYPYELPKEDGADFTILNCIDDWWISMNHIMDYDEPTGAATADAVYNRNRKIEEELGIKVCIDKQDFSQLFTLMTQNNISGDDLYDICYIPLCAWGNSTIQGNGSQHNLYTIPELHMDQPWWNQAYIESVTIGKDGKEAIYALSDYANLCGYSYTGMLFFNIDMMNDHNLPMPYDAVREGSWTYDKLFTEYAPVAASLNGAETFDKKPDSPAIYGLGVQHEEGPMCFINGSGSYIVSKNDENMPVFNESLNRLSDVYDKLVGYFSTAGNAVMVNVDNDFNAKVMFLNGQSLFFYQTVGLATAPEFRESEMTYGLLPIPKYEESQANYCSPISEYALALNIPISVADTDRVGRIVDYYEYLSYTELYPVFQNDLCYKGLRDNDSIDMLTIINESQTADIGYLYGFTTSLMKKLCAEKAILQGNNTFASDLEANKKAIGEQITKMLEEQN